VTEDFVQSVLAVIDGWRVVYAPRAVSLERASATLDDEATRRARLVTGRLQALCHLMPPLVRRQPWFAWQVVSHKGLRPAVPWLLVTAAASNVVAAKDRRWARAPLALQGLFYGAAVSGWWHERRGRRRAPLYLPYYFCRMNLASLSGMWKFLGRRYGATWTKVKRG
jgi:hypothetical protein